MVKINDALKIAQDADLDLVEVVPNAKPPVCKVMNYGKFKFEQNKKAQQAKKKQKQIQIKEVKLRPSTEENDYQTKLTNLRRFITDGDKAKITIRFRGRELAHKELGMKQVEPNPWSLLGDQYPVGAVLNGTQKQFIWSI